MIFNYQIAGLSLQFDTDSEIVDNKESVLFRISDISTNPDITCKICGRAELPHTPGELFSFTDSTHLYLDGDVMWQELLNRKNDQPLFLSRYSVNDMGEIQLWVLEKERSYTNRIEHIWSAVDLPYQLLKAGILTLHSSAVEVNGEALLFLAPSGTGKSTQARLWSTFCGSTQLNGDKVGVTCRNNIAIAHGLPFCGTSGICEKYEIPVKALVLLAQAKENVVQRLTGASALRAVMQNCFGHQAVPGCIEKILQVAMPLLNQVPVYKLFCTPERAVQLLEKCLKEEGD